MSDLYVLTVNGRERVSSVGSVDVSTGWQLVYARDVPEGYHVVIAGQVVVARGMFRRHNVIVFPGSRIVWEGCLLWTYTGVTQRPAAG